MLLLSRKKFLLIAFSAFLIYFLAFKLKFLIGSSYADGKIIAFQAGYRALSPLVEFTADNKVYQFIGDAGLDDDVDKEVRVVYKTDNPQHAKIFSFFGFWWSGIIYGLVPLLLFSALILSFVAKGESVVIEYRRYFKKKDESEPFKIKIKNKGELN